MCLVLVAIDLSSDWPLVVAANRDEYHERPADPLHWWPDRPVLAGRDRVAHGTWMGAGPGRRFGCILNDHRVSAPPAAPSRGSLVPDFLECADPVGWRARLAERRGDYAGFHLVTGDAGGVHYCASEAALPVALGPGLHIVDNAGLDTADPRSRRANETLGPLLRAGASDADLLEGLADAVAPEAGPGDARALFIADPVFGTRCSSVLRVDATGRVRFRERRFDADGRPSEASVVDWDPAGTTSDVCPD